MRSKGSNLVIVAIAAIMLLVGLSLSGLLPLMLTPYGSYWDPERDVYLYSIKLGDNFDFYLRKQMGLGYLDCGRLAGAELRLTPQDKPVLCKFEPSGIGLEASKWEIDYRGAKGAKVAYIDPDQSTDGLPNLHIKLDYSGSEYLGNGITDYFFSVVMIVDADNTAFGPSAEYTHRYPYGTYIYVAIEGQSKIYDITVFSLGKKAYADVHGAYSAGKYLIWWRVDLPAPNERPIEELGDKAIALYVLRIAVGEPITGATTTFTRTLTMWKEKTVTVTEQGTTRTKIVYVPQTITITATQTIVSGTTRIKFITVTQTKTQTIEQPRTVVKEVTITRTLPGAIVTTTVYKTKVLGAEAGLAECLYYDQEGNCLIPTKTFIAIIIACFIAAAILAYLMAPRLAKRRR